MLLNKKLFILTIVIFFFFALNFDIARATYPISSPAPTPTVFETHTPLPSITPVTTPSPGEDTTRPTVSITSPSSGITFSYRIFLTAVAQDNIGVVGVRFYREGEVALGLEDASSPYSMYLYASTLPVGQHTITARARDVTGNVTISAPITVNVVPPPDTTPPAISAITPIEVGPYSATIRWTTNEPANGQLEFCPSYYRCGNNTPIVSELTTAHAINLFNLTPGTRYYFWVRSRDAAGNLTTSPTRSFITAPIPDTQAPLVTMTAPVNGSTVTGRIVVSANATDNIGIAGVRFYRDNEVLLKAEDTYPPYSMYFYTDGLSGPHTLYATARDTTGNTATSDRISININNPDLSFPYISAISASGITPFAATIRWTTNEPANSQVEFCLTSSRCANNSPLVAEMTTAHIINLSGLTPNTTYYYRVKSRDAGGNLTTSLARSFITLSGL